MNDTPIVYPITRISKARTDTTRYLSLFRPTLVLDSFLLFHFSVFFSFLWAFVQSFEIQPLYIAVYTSFVRPLSKLYTYRSMTIHPRGCNLCSFTPFHATHLRHNRSP